MLVWIPHCCCSYFLFLFAPSAFNMLSKVAWSWVLRTLDFDSGSGFIELELQEAHEIKSYHHVGHLASRSFIAVNGIDECCSGFMGI